MKVTKKTRNIIFLIVAILVALLIYSSYLPEANTEKSVILGKKLGKNNEENAQEYDYGTETGEVIVKYLNEKGESLLDGEGNSLEEHLQGIIGTQYQTTRKKVDYYISNGYEPVNRIGDFKEEPITVIYYYKPVSETVSVENNNNEITVKVQNVLKDRDYTLRLEQESTEGKKLTGGKFTLVDAKAENELMNGTTVNGGLTLGAINVNNEVDEQYEISEDKAPEGYLKAIRDDNKRFAIRLSKSYNEESKVYELKATSGDREFELEENEEESEIIVKVRNEKLKTYDLAIKKFVKSVNEEATEGRAEAVVGIDGTIEYIKNEQEINVTNGQKLIYEFKIYNGGNENMQAPIVTDILPKGLKYLPESQTNIENGWSLEDGKLTTSKLVGETIEGIDVSSETEVKFKTLYLEVEVDETLATEGNTLVNTTNIPVDEREKDTNNNSDTAEITIVKEEEKIADLCMQKYLNSVDGEILADREIKAKNEDGKIVFTKNNEIYKVANNQKLIFTLRVFNVGNEDTYGRQVIEYLPDGLDIVKDSKINQDNGWVACKEDKAGNLKEVEKIEEANVMKTDILVTENIEGFETKDGQTPKYKDVQIELIVNENEVKTEERLVTNIAKVATSTTDPDKENDSSSETVKVKVFDLAIIKYIEEITIKDDQGETTTHIGLENKGKIFKKEIDKKKINNTQVIVVYGLKIKNVGEIPGSAKEIYDHIPEDLKLKAEDTSWVMDGQNAKYSGIAKKVINPGDSTIVNFTCVWDLNEESLGERNNKADITEYSNEFDAKDPTPDKDNEEKFIISIKTGALETTIYTLAGIVILSIIALIIKNRKNKIK